MEQAQSGYVWHSTWAHNTGFEYEQYPSLEERFKEVLNALKVSIPTNLYRHEVYLALIGDANIDPSAPSRS